MRQLTVEHLLAQTAAAEYPAGRWVISGGPMRFVGVTTGRRSLYRPDRMVVIGCSLLTHSWGWNPTPHELYLRPADVVEVDPAKLPSDLVAAVEEAWMAAEQERLAN